MSYWIMGKRCVAEVEKREPHRIIEILRTPKVRAEKLEKLVGSSSHQGVIARVKKKPALGIDDLAGASRLLALDSIEDPQNVGAIFRAAECFGVDGLLWSKNRGAPMTPVVSKVSVGASEVVPYAIVSNLAESLRQLKDRGFWVVVADMGGENYQTLDLPEKTVLVMGSEHKGVRPLIAKLADLTVSIPLAGEIDSLNVSQAAAVLLSGLR